MMLQTVFFSYSIYGKSLLAVSRVKKEERLRYQKVIEIVWQHSLDFGDVVAHWEGTRLLGQRSWVPIRHLLQ